MLWLAGSRPAALRAGPRSHSRRADAGDESVHLAPEVSGLGVEVLGGLGDLRGDPAGLRSRLVDADDVGRDFLRAEGSLLHVLRDLTGGGALLLDRGGNR